MRILKYEAKHWKNHQTMRKFETLAVTYNGTDQANAKICKSTGILHIGAQQAQKIQEKVEYGFCRE